MRSGFRGLRSFILGRAAVFAVVLLFASSLGVAADENESPQAPSKKPAVAAKSPTSSPGARSATAPRASVRDLIRQLDDDEYHVRQEATRQLATAGIGAVGPLAAAATGDNLEVAFRAIDALKELGASSDETCQDAAFSAIEALASGRQRTLSRAQVALTDLRRASQSRAAERLKQLGTAISDNDADENTGRVIMFGGAGGRFVVAGRGTSDIYVGGVSVRIDADWKGTVKDLALLKRLERVDQLFLTGPQITDDWMAELKGIAPKLRHVALKQTKVTDRGLAVLSHSESMSYLDVMHTPVTDEAVATIASLSNVQYVRLYGTKVSANAVQLLAKTLPNARIDRRGGALLGVGGSVGETPCVINTVQPESAAAKAGIEEGDTILKFDGKAVQNFTELTAAIAEKNGGDRVEIDLLRPVPGSDTPKRFPVNVTLGSW